MIHQTVELAQFQRNIYTAETASDAKELGKLITPDQWWTFDVETNAQPIQHRDFKIRLIQFGNCYDAYIFPVEKRNLGAPIIRRLLETLPSLIAHNAKFDILSLERAGYLKSKDAIADRFIDTIILSHLIDPRGKQDGGTGQRLVDLCARYVDPESADSDKELKKLFKSLSFKTLEEGYRRVDLFHPKYLEYSGADVILTALLYDTIAALVWEQQR